MFSIAGGSVTFTHSVVTSEKSFAPATACSIVISTQEGSAIHASDVFADGVNVSSTPTTVDVHTSALRAHTVPSTSVALSTLPPPSPASRSLQLSDSAEAIIAHELERVIAHQDLSRDYLPRLFQNDPTLKELHLANSDCSDVALIALTDALKLNTMVTTVVLDGNSITNEGARLLAEMLFVNRSVTTLSLKSNHIGVLGAEALVAALESNCKLTVCNIEGNDMIVGEVCKELDILTRLNAKPASLKDSVLAIKRQKAPKFLNLSRAEIARAEHRELTHDNLHHLDDWAAETLAFYLKSDACVEHLDLSFHHIGDEGVLHLAEMLRVNRTLDKVNLQGNLITVVGVDHLVDALEVNNSCRFVCLMKNLVGHQDVVRLEWALVLNRQPLTLKPLLPMLAANNVELTQLVLDVSDSHRHFDDVTARLVCDALRHNTTVRHLQITNSKISVVGAKFLADILSFNRYIRVLDLTSNPLADGGVDIAKAVTWNTSLTQLILKNTSLTLDGAAHFADMLKENATLLELDLSYNSSIGGAGKMLLQALNHNNVLIDLNLEGCGISPEVIDDLADRKRLNSEPPLVRETISQLFSSTMPCKEVLLSGPALNGRCLQDSSMKLVAEAIEANFTATRIDVSRNQLSLLGIASLVMALSENRTTTINLDISYNPKCGRDPLELARMMARVLQTHQTLRVLNLSGLSLNDDAVSRLVRVLDSDHSFPIRSIILDDNPEVTDAMRFNLHVVVSMNSLQVRIKDVLRPLWNTWRVCAEELRSFPKSHLDLRFLNPVVDRTIPGEQERIDAGLGLLCQMLRRMEGITSLDYSENEVSDVGAAHLAELLEDTRSKTKLVSVNVSKNRFTDAGLVTLKAAAEKSLQLRLLDAFGCPDASPAALEALRRTVLYNCQPSDIQDLLVRISNDDPNTTTLDLGGGTGTAYQLNDDQMLLISEGIQRNTHLRIIDVSHAHMTWKSVSVLLEAITARVAVLRLEKLVLRNLMLSEEDSAPLCKAMRAFLIADQVVSSSAAHDIHSSALRYVDISCNVIDSCDIPLLVEGVAAHKHLEFFGVSNCGLSETDMLRVYVSVAKNKKHVSDDEPRDVLAEVKRNSPDVTELVCTDGVLNNILVMDICDAIRDLGQTCHLTRLVLSRNELNDTSVVHCLRSLAHNTSIREINLSENLLGDQTVLALVEILSTNSTLCVVDLSLNPSITSESLDVLRATVLGVNDTIYRIDISDEEDLQAYADEKRKQQDGVASAENSFCGAVVTAAPAPTTTRPQSSPTLASSGGFSFKSALRALKLFFLEELTINQQLVLKKMIPRIAANDESLTVLNVHCPEFVSAAHNDVGCDHLATAMMFNEHLKEVNLSDGQITDKGCIALARALNINRSVKTLNLSGNAIGDSGVSALIEVLQVNKVLSVVNVSNTKRVVSPEQLHQARRVLVDNDTLLEFIVGSNEGCASRMSSATRSVSATSQRRRSTTTSAGTSRRPVQMSAEELRRQAAIKQLAKMTMLNNRHLSLKEFLRSATSQLCCEIDCSNARETQDGRLFDNAACEILYQTLKDDTVVTKINLANNDIDAEGAAFLAELIRENVAITSLNLSQNNIGDGAVALHDALVSNNALIELKLEKANPAPLTLEKIGVLLQLNREHLAFKREVLLIGKKNENHVISCVNTPEISTVVKGLPGFANRKLQVDDESIELLCSLLRADLIIQTLDYAWNLITDSGFHSMVGLCKRNKGIQQLKLAHNLITDDSIRFLASAMPTLPNLREVDLSFNSLTEHSSSAIIKMLRDHPTLHSIRAAGNRIPPRDLDTMEFLSRLNQQCSTELRTLLIEIYDNDPTRTIVDMNSYFSMGNWNRDGSTMQLLTYALLNNTHVTTLELEFNDVNDNQFVSICNVLRTNRTITTLNLANNLITDVSLFVSSASSGQGYAVQNLSLRRNKMGQAAAMDFAALLRHPLCSLKQLDVSFNEWGRLGASILTAALPMNDSLTAIEIEGPGIDAEAAAQAQFATTLHYNSVKLARIKKENFSPTFELDSFLRDSPRCHSSVEGRQQQLSSPM